MKFNFRGACKGAFFVQGREWQEVDGDEGPAVDGKETVGYCDWN